MREYEEFDFVAIVAGDDDIANAMSAKCLSASSSDNRGCAPTSAHQFENLSAMRPSKLSPAFASFGSTSFTASLVIRKPSSSNASSDFSRVATK